MSETITSAGSASNASSAAAPPGHEPHPPYPAVATQRVTQTVEHVDLVIDEQHAHQRPARSPTITATAAVLRHSRLDHTPIVGRAASHLEDRDRPRRGRPSPRPSGVAAFTASGSCGWRAAPSSHSRGSVGDRVASSLDPQVGVCHKYGLYAGPGVVGGTSRKVIVGLKGAVVLDTVDVLSSKGYARLAKRLRSTALVSSR